MRIKYFIYIVLVVLEDVMEKEERGNLVIEEVIKEDQEIEKAIKEIRKEIRKEVSKIKNDFKNKLFLKFKMLVLYLFLLIEIIGIISTCCIISNNINNFFKIVIISLLLYQFFQFIEIFVMLQQFLILENHFS